MGMDTSLMDEDTTLTRSELNRARTGNGKRCHCGAKLVEVAREPRGQHGDWRAHYGCSALARTGHHRDRHE